MRTILSAHPCYRSRTTFLPCPERSLWGRSSEPGVGRYGACTAATRSVVPIGLLTARPNQAEFLILIAQTSCFCPLYLTRPRYISDLAVAPTRLE